MGSDLSVMRWAFVVTASLTSEDQPKPLRIGEFKKSSRNGRRTCAVPKILLKPRLELAEAQR